MTVNRWWQEFFGQGLVTSVEDFGTRGDPPSHPGLLDWLAVEFMESGWSMKHVHRVIVTSATYRQSSSVPESVYARDPQNRWLGRGARFRLSAEAVRDNALAVSGLLNLRQGGPPIYPPQPEGIWRHVGRNAPVYATSPPGERYRRSIYVVWRRSAPYPSFVTFDAPDRASCVVRRPRTNTALQALTLLNDPAYFEIARGFAEHICRRYPHVASAPNGGGQGDLDEPADRQLTDRLHFAFRSCLSRMPTAEEHDQLASYWTSEFERLRHDPQAVRELLGKANHKNGRNPMDENVDHEAELAAWVLVANVLLNLDETITHN